MSHCFHAVVTGGAQGLGRVFAECLLRLNYSVILFDVNESLLARTSSELRSKFGNSRCETCSCDVQQSDQMEKHLQRLSEQHKIRVLVNNAGVNDETNWRRTLGINLGAVAHLSLFAPRFLHRAPELGPALVINVASMAGFVPLSLAPIYTATKHGVLGLTRALGSRQVLQLTGVRYLCFCPAFVADIGMAAHMLSDESIAKEALKVVGSTPLISADTIARSFTELVQAAADADKAGAASGKSPVARGALIMVVTHEGPHWIKSSDLSRNALGGAKL